MAATAVAAQSGHEDLLAVNADYSQIRFSPWVEKKCSLKTVAVKAFSINRATNTPVNRERKDTRVPKNHDLVVALSDWDRLDLNTQAVSF